MGSSELEGWKIWNSRLRCLPDPGRLPTLRQESEFLFGAMEYDCTYQAGWDLWVIKLTVENETLKMDEPGRAVQLEEREGSWRPGQK